MPLRTTGEMQVQENFGKYFALFLGDWQVTAVFLIDGWVQEQPHMWGIVQLLSCCCLFTITSVVLQEPVETELVKRMASSSTQQEHLWNAENFISYSMGWKIEKEEQHISSDRYKYFWRIKKEKHKRRGMCQSISYTR